MPASIHRVRAMRPKNEYSSQKFRVPGTSTGIRTLGTSRGPLPTKTQASQSVAYIEFQKLTAWGSLILQFQRYCLLTLCIVITFSWELAPDPSGRITQLARFFITPTRESSTG